MAARIIDTYDSFDDATITASSNSDDAANVTDPFLTRKWVSSTGETHWIKWELPVSRIIEAFVIFGHNFDDYGQNASTTLYLQANDTDEWEDPAINYLIWSKESDDERVPIVYWPNQMFKWWRLYITIPSALNPPIEFGRICAGRYTALPQTFSVSRIDTLNDLSVMQDTVGANHDFRELSKQWMLTRALSGVSLIDEFDRNSTDNLLALFDKLGKTCTFPLILDPSTVDNSCETAYYVRIASDLSGYYRDVEYGDINLLFTEAL